MKKTSGKGPGLQLAHVAITIVCITTTLTSCITRTVSRQPKDHRQEQLNHTAYTAFRLGDFEQAAHLYEQALQRGYLRDDGISIANALYHLAASQARLRRFDAARVSLQEARTVLRRLPGTQVADVLLLEAKVAERQGERHDTLRLIEEGLRVVPPAPDAIKAAFYVLQGRLAAEQHDLAGARAALAASDRYRRDPQKTAGRVQLVGRIAQLEDQPMRAATAFDQEAELHRSALHYEAMGKALARAGAAYAAAGQWPVAANRFLRAGRSAQLQDLTHDAVPWLEQAIEAATKGHALRIAEQAQRRLRLMRGKGKAPVP